VLAEHDIELRYPDLPDLETTVRSAPDGAELLFLLNHSDEPVEVDASRDSTDLLSGGQIRSGGRITLGPRGVAVLCTTAEPPNGRTQ